ncbi:small integral membrane protein 12 isoform X2 [Oreochromis niloticus]|uniref:small integral membrane protein 12 isoform X2 n=1 Tax=Oreochromis niloticus TaxID=8128 RepID=UPI00039423DA|nr:small integral membrane protein 12 isoform X2 [Oreochromis niloticus]XP_005453937.1 small integral membrane protein 12 isoform X2 [Oreochromis niloticus]XP_005453938.1 small integral membrane protein 12 isoform X2 [Oreochromis niloticus]
MWPVVWTALRTYAPYVTFPVAFVVGAVGYHLEWFIRGTPKPREEERGIQELREERKLQEQVGMDSTKLEDYALRAEERTGSLAVIKEEKNDRTLLETLMICDRT